MSYITGAHAFKFGVGDIFGYFNQRDFDNNSVSYRFNNGVPNQITMRALPVEFRVDVNHQFGAYVQDRWTVDRADAQYRTPVRLVPEQLSRAGGRPNAARADAQLPVSRRPTTCPCTT